MRKMYKKPQVETLPMMPDAHVMLKPSGSGPQPVQLAPKRVGDTIEP